MSRARWFAAGVASTVAAALAARVVRDTARSLAFQRKLAAAGAAAAATVRLATGREPA